ncbi:hypothetical protein B0H19DRAFT_11680 [Mycena capillaripes]|nr:hypothetical protein B0H19DRAFT_11680 [Mycena capillaripes]
MILGVADLPRYLSGSRPSSSTAEKAGGGAKWVYLSVASRCCSAPSRALRGRLTAPVRRRDSYGWGLPTGLRTHIASIVFHHLLWRRPERNTRERTYRDPCRVLSYRLVLSARWHTLGVSTTRLATLSHNRRFFFYTSSPAIHAPSTIFRRRRSQPRISCVAHRPSSTPSTPTAPERSRRHAARLAAACCPRTRSAARAIRATTWNPLQCAVRRPCARPRPSANPSPALRH